jgi:chromatin remodeling complex protein RSC6
MQYLRQEYESNPTIIENESPERIAVREFVKNQTMNTFGMPIAEYILNSIVNGFFLFNTRSDKKYMLANKTELLKYIADENVSLEEKLYFQDIFLYNQRPSFLSKNEHEYIRACGTLDGFEEEDDEEIDEIEDSAPVQTPSSSRMPFGFIAPTLLSEELAPVQTPSSSRMPFGFITPTLLSEELARFLGKPPGTRMARTDVSKEINKYIRAKGLVDRENGRKINPDENLRNLLRITSRDELTYFNLQKYMKPHFIR